MTDDSKQVRGQIHLIDIQISRLLSQRALLERGLSPEKETASHGVLEPGSATERDTGPFEAAQVFTIPDEIIAACRPSIRRIKVAYLGPSGTFSQQAVYHHFGRDVDELPCGSIDEVFRATEACSADFGVVPIENSAEGAVSRTLDLLLSTTAIVSGDISISIRHCLMSKTGSMDGVDVICAHAQGLAQCQGWLNQHYPAVERRAVASNAEAARLAGADSTVAAIAGEIAGEQYGLGMIRSSIQDDVHNRTRFAVIGPSQSQPCGHDQTSLILAVVNKAGALYRLLEPLARHGVSMTRFESRPARRGTWEYYFYVDVEGHKFDEPVAKALEELKLNAAFFKVLGSYRRDA